jgi:cytochrome c biogenesis protein CcmG/thiol:disulfide interchange protein DsbE
VSDAAADERTDAATRSPRFRWLRLVAAAVAVLAVGVGAVFGYTLDRDPNLVDTPLIGTTAATREVPYLEKRGSFSLRQLRGKVAVVNFWASWCVPCRQEHSSLVAAASAYRDAGVVFVGVVYQDRTSSAVAFLDELGRGRGYQYVTDPLSKLAIDFGVFGVPETFFLDRRGRIVAKISGASTLPLLSGVLDDILAGRTPDPSTTTGPVQSGRS